MDPQELMEKWKSTLQQIPANNMRQLSLPLNVFSSEVIQLCHAAAYHYEPREENGNQLPGLNAVSYRLKRETIDELRELVDLLAYVQVAIIFGAPSISPALRQKVERADHLIFNIASAIEFLLDDEIDEPADNELARLHEQERAMGDAIPIKAQTLLAYAMLAKSLADRLKDDQSFQLAWISESEALAQELRQSRIPAPIISNPNIDLRNRIVTLMLDRVSLVRRAVAHVFRDHPDVRRKFASTYERKRRAANRAQKEQSKAKEKLEMSTATAAASMD